MRTRQITEWYNQYGDAILQYIIIMIRDYQQAEDLTQDTFIKAYNKIDSFEGNANPRTWLYSIAHNTTVDFLRKQKPIKILQDLLPTIKDNNPLPEELVQIREDSRELYRAIEQLKKSYREVIVLRKIMGFSIEETSNILHWSEGKVKTTLHRAISALEKQYGEEGVLYERTHQ